MCCEYATKMRTTFCILCQIYARDYAHVYYCCVSIAVPLNKISHDRISRCTFSTHYLSFFPSSLRLTRSVFFFFIPPAVYHRSLEKYCSLLQFIYLTNYLAIELEEPTSIDNIFICANKNEARESKQI